jgi:predicted transcriptional regulator of viral defense system
MHVRPLTFLREWLEENANENHYLFSLRDLRILFPSHSESAYRTILSRATSSGVLLRICQGIFI